MHSFHYRDGRLYCEGVDLAEVAEIVSGRRFMSTAPATILDHYRRFDEALAEVDHLICYAVKANSNGAILSLLAEAGAGFDIVSGGELFRVLKAGGDAARCTFAGVGKSREEIEFALETGVFSFNVESEAELENVNRIAAAKGRARADRFARESRRRCGHARLHFDRQRARTNSESRSIVPGRFTNGPRRWRRCESAACKCISAPRSTRRSPSSRRSKN